MSVDVTAVIQAMDALIDAGAEELPVSQAEHDALCDHFGRERSFFERYDHPIQPGDRIVTVYMWTPLVIVPEPT